MELYAAVRLAVVDEGLSHHEAGRRFGIDRRTVKKMLSYSAPPGYRRTKPVRRPKLDGFTGIVDAILEADTDPDVPRKQRHTAHRIFERLRDEHGFTGGYTIVKDYVRSRRQSTREAFVPLHHPPGHAQVDFGEAVVEVGGRREKVAFFCLILPHSNLWFVKAYPRETTEAFTATENLAPYSLYGLMNAAFKLIDLLPSAVLDWIGGRAGAGDDGSERTGGAAVAGISRMGAVRIGAREPARRGRELTAPAMHPMNGREVDIG